MKWRCIVSCSGMDEAQRKNLEEELNDSKSSKRVWVTTIPVDIKWLPVNKHWWSRN